MFLIAGYARYNCPYVWIRTNHERLVQFGSPTKLEKDFPLQLKSTSSWKEKGVFTWQVYMYITVIHLTDVTPWDIIAELVTICTVPCPPNPFTVDFDYFECLPLPERSLASGAMVTFLRKVLASGNHHYNKRGIYSIIHA